ncbi:MAG: ATP-dependent Clp protease proteolytic subunit [Clostridiales bacterium]|nr:ATP-dependent Clp protease proteolytic subunit [Candidatus Apopatocola equi]MCQ2438478.1 ATP-dependent Clp protease proteolytic subunit [Oscillospiraceae bacterium]
MDENRDCGLLSVGGIRILTVIGQIEGHMLLPAESKTTKYEHMLPLLCAIEEDETASGLLLLLNTVGGDTEAGLAMAELIASMTKPTASLVLGGGHSIGVPLAVAADRSFIVPSAAMTLHPVRLSGTVIGVMQTWNSFERIQERINAFTVKHSRISPERLRSLIYATGELTQDVGSVLYGEQAVEEGLIDELGGLDRALAYLHGRQ